MIRDSLDDNVERMRIARAASTSHEMLASLSYDAYWGVRWRVAENPSTSPDTLAFLSQDEDVDVRHHVARNPNTPYEIWIPDAGIWIPVYGRILP